MKRYLCFFIMIGLLVLAAPVAAQDAPTPEPVGLRPDAPTYALHGPYWVGTQAFDAQTDFHPTTVQVWYPALNPSGAQETITYRQFIPGMGQDATTQGRAIENAPPLLTDEPYPLVIFAVGNGSIRFQFAYLTEHLASEGFVVMSIEYGESPALQSPGDPDLSMYTRPKDVSWQIDYANQLTDAGGALQGLIDTQNIAVVGHSYGAYTAQVAAGAQLDLSGPTSWCVQYPDLPLSQRCNTLIQKVVGLAGLNSAPEALWPAWSDARVKAIVPLAPEAVEFGAESFKDVTIPTLMLSGTKDRLEFSELPLYYPTVYDNLASPTKALVKFANADHMIFFSACNDMPWLVEVGAHWVCSDPVWDMDRAHDLINHFTTAFLLDVLKGDKDAAAALAPDAVSFPGIEYQAQGF